ncbi:MAG TPA: rRNA maturation RNase YbeY [Gammaproteobacteria bacterium]|nr:rRNA maturation RNase YbeY [Gammaproteobacteria bacterium]
MQLDLQVVVSDPELPAAQDFEQWARAALSIVEHPGGELTLRIVSEEEMSSFNLRFRGHHSSTNVLSFPVDDLPGVTTGILGDILVCPAVLRREVAGSETPLAAHWAHMVVHGVLHLCGYDHQSEGDAGVMEGLESDVLQGFGFTNPYRVS